MFSELLLELQMHRAGTTVPKINKINWKKVEKIDTMLCDDSGRARSV